MLEALAVGLIPGSAYALIAVSILLTYRMLGVLDFSQTTVGAFGTYAGLAFLGLGVPDLAAAALGIVCGMVLSAILGLIMVRWFSGARIEIKSSVTIAVMLALTASAFRVFGNDQRPLTNIFPRINFAAFGVHFTLTTIAGLVFALVIGAGIALVLRMTRIGILLRALSERPTTAELLGIPVGTLAVAVWAVAGGIATLAITLVAPNRTTNFIALSTLLLPGMAGALLGLFRSVPRTIAGGILIGLLEGGSSYFSAIAPYRDALSFVVILLVLLWSQRRETWDEAR
jgi:branched-chain amino acid transport system permease protein